MSTTNPASSSGSAGTSDAAPRSTVVQFDSLKKRKRLGRLEATRSHLATMAAQQRSHGLDEDANESFTLQLGLETAIRDEFPEDYAALFPTWVERDVLAEHPRGVLTADCGICRSIATASGINLLPPEVA